MNIEELKRLVSLGKVAQPTAKVILAALEIVEAIELTPGKADVTLESGQRIAKLSRAFDAVLAATPVPGQTGRETR